MLLLVDLIGTILFSRAFDFIPGTTDQQCNVFTTLGELVYTDGSVYAAGNHHTVTMRNLNGTQQMLFCQVAYAGTLCNMKVVKLE